MLTLENLLSVTHLAASFGAGVTRMCDCSLYATRLLSKDANFNFSPNPAPFYPSRLFLFL